MPTKRRPKGEGSITKLPNGNLKMTVTVGVGMDGKQKRKSVTAKTKAELMKRVAELRIAAGISSPSTEPLYFKEVVDMFFHTREETLTEGTLANYKMASKLLFEPLYDYRIDKITGDMIDVLLDKMRKRDGSSMSKNTIKSMKTKLSVVLNFAVAKGLLATSPIRNTRQRKASLNRVDTLTLPTEAQIKQLLKEAKEYDVKHNEANHAPFYPLFLLAIATGMRAGELLNIDTKNVNMENNTISIQTQLTRYGCDMPLKTTTSRRIIYVQPEILSEVMSLVPPSPMTTKLWCQNGRQVRYETIKAQIHRFLKKRDYLPDGFTFHCFRHYHATQLLLKGINPKEVSKRLGHASIKVTLDLYAHWMPEMDAQAANSIGTSYIV